MDHLTPERRSWNMSRIPGRDTAPEKALRQLLHRLGFRFRLATGAKLSGRPDVVLPRYRSVVFMHGCFWHRHQGCGRCYMPKSRVDFWNRKFNANVARDREVLRTLRCEGWHVVVVWECQMKDVRALERRLVTIKSRHESGSRTRALPR